MGKYRWRLGAIGLVAMLLLPITVFAATTTDISGAVEQSYNTDPATVPGMIVELKGAQQNTVAPVTSGDINHMLGVVVPLAGATIALTPGSGASGQVLVATTGRQNVLVSNQGGAVKPGDYITVSSLAGIGMKAGSAQTEVIGRAAGSFDGKKGVLSLVVVDHGPNVAVGQVAVDLHLTANPFYQKSSPNNLPGWLQRSASSVANKPVSPARLYLSFILLLGTIAITGSMFYGAAKSGIIAIGRNPLSRQSILRGLLQTVLAGLLVFAAGVFAVYLILKL